MKNNKGITLITLVITIVILVIITAVTVNVSTNFIHVAKFENVETELLLIQGKVKVMADKKAIGEIEEEDLYGEKQESKFDEDVGCVQSALSDKEMIMEWLNINTQEGCYGL